MNQIIGCNANCATKHTLQRWMQGHRDPVEDAIAVGERGGGAVKDGVGREREVGSGGGGSPGGDRIMALAAKTEPKLGELPGL